MMYHSITADRAGRVWMTKLSVWLFRLALWKLWHVRYGRSLICSINMAFTNSSGWRADRSWRYSSRRRYQRAVFFRPAFLTSPPVSCSSPVDCTQYPHLISYAFLLFLIWHHYTAENHLCKTTSPPFAHFLSQPQAARAPACRCKRLYSSYIKKCLKI